MTYGDREYIKYYFNHLREIEKFQEMFRRLPESKLVRDINNFYNQHKCYRASDLLKLLGNPNGSISVPISFDELWERWAA